MKGNKPFFARARRHLEEHGAIEEVTVNPVTGSILIVHDTELAEIAGEARQLKLFDVRSSAPTPKTIFNQISGGFQGLNRRLLQMSDGHLDIPSLVFLSLVGSGLYQIMRGNLRAPAWYTAFWYALSVFARGSGAEWDAIHELTGDSPVSDALEADFGDHY